MTFQRYAIYYAPPEGGLARLAAEWLGWDPTAVRLAYILLSILSAAFPGLLVYLILWLVTPLAED